jgi:uncharacterized membrane protein
MNHMLVSVFPDDWYARQALEALREQHREGDLTIYQSVMVAKDADAKVSVRDSSERGPLGAAFGMTGGALVGALGGPVGLAVGTTLGGVVGAVYDMLQQRTLTDLVSAVGSGMRPRTVALVVDTDERDSGAVDRELEPLGGITSRRTRREMLDERRHREAGIAKADFDQRSMALAEQRRAVDEP